MLLPFFFLLVRGGAWLVRTLRACMRGRLGSSAELSWIRPERGEGKLGRCGGICLLFRGNPSGLRAPLFLSSFVVTTIQISKQYRKQQPTSSPTSKKKKKKKEKMAPCSCSNCANCNGDCSGCGCGDCGVCI